MYIYFNARVSPYSIARELGLLDPKDGSAGQLGVCPLRGDALAGAVVDQDPESKQAEIAFGH